MGIYLIAKSSIEILDEYNGEQGFFIKTFGLNTKRNKNGWRVSWASIQKRIAEYYNQKSLPGILYTKCTEAGCDLDHTDAATYESSLHVQEPFRVTDIVGHTIDEDNETAYLIHKLTQPHDGIDQETLDKFKQDIIDGTIQFVSPSVWPISGQYDIIKGERMPNGEPIINAYDWLPLHDAFVNDPAFGTDARVTATCEGEDCQVKLLTARQLKAYNENHDADGRFGYSDNPSDDTSSDESPGKDETAPTQKLDTTPKLENAISSKQTELATHLEKAGVPQGEMDKIMSPLSRTTDPDSSFGSTVIQKAWDDAIKEHPELQEDRDKLEQFQDQVNTAINDKFAKTDTLYRGTTTDELDDIVEKRSVEPYNYNFVSMTMDKDAGTGFGKNASDTNGVTLELDKEQIANQKLWNDEPMVIKPVKYSVYADHAGHGEEMEGSYPISFADEMEVRSYQFKADKAIKSITIHQSEYMDKGEAQRMADAYSKKMPDVTFKTDKPIKAKSVSEVPPVMIRHKGHLHFVSATKKMSDEIQAEIDRSGKLDTELLPDIFKNNSFSACACSTLRMTPEEQLKAKLVASEKDTEDMKAKLTAAEKDTKEKGDKIKELESKLAKMEGSIAACGKCGSTKHTTENHTKENDGEGVDSDGDADGDKAAKASLKSALTKLQSVESKLAQPMITTMLKAREIAGATAEDLAALEKSLNAKSLEEVETIYNNESVFLKAATVEQPEEGLHAPFNGATTGALNGKTLEEIAGETA